MPNEMRILEFGYIESNANRIAKSSCQYKGEISYRLNEILIDKHRTPSHNQIDGQMNILEFVNPNRF